MIRRPLYFAAVVLALFFSAAFGTGCTEHTEENSRPVSVEREDAELLVLVGVDLSGSFADRMARDGEAYAFTLRVADQYFRNSIGTNNRIVIAQLSATERALLWDGTPIELRQRFPTADEFRDFLLTKSNPNGSRIHDGIADAFDYVLSEPGVANRKTRTAVFVLSDFEDNLSDAAGEQRLTQSLAAFAKTDGVVGFYFLAHDRVPAWRERLRQSGVKQWVCDSEIVANPTLPSFE